LTLIQANAIPKIVHNLMTWSEKGFMIIDQNF